MKHPKQAIKFVIAAKDARPSPDCPRVASTDFYCGAISAPAELPLLAGSRTLVYADKQRSASAVSKLKFRDNAAGMCIGYLRALSNHYWAQNIRCNRDSQLTSNPKAGGD